MVLYLDEADVDDLLTMPMAIAAVEDAMVELSRGVAFDVPRSRLRGAVTSLHMMQAEVPSEHAIGYKCYTVSRGVARFLIHLFDSRDGRLTAILEGRHLGAMRTGAASGVATRHLARPGASTLGVIGSGRQAAAQIEAVCAVQPVKDIKVYSRDRGRLEAFCAAFRERTGIAVHAAESAEQAVRGSDVICTVTTSATPVVEADWIAPGSHLNAAGSNMLSRREIATLALERCALIVVDSREGARREAGDLLPLIESGRLHWSRLTELGAVASGAALGRRAPDHITCFKSLGLAVQDVMLGARLVRLARERGIGTRLPFA